MWCGCQECEDKIKEQFAATSRCMPFEQETLSDTCVCCGKPAKKMVYWARHIKFIKRQALRATKKACSAFFSGVIAWKI